MPPRWFFLILLVAVGCAEPIGVETERRAVIDGEATTAFAAVGQLAYGEGLIGAGCTATLVGSKTVVTAAHCVCEDSEYGADCPQRPGPAYFVLPSGGIREVTRSVIHPGWAWNGSTLVGDLAVLSLESPMPGIVPMPLLEDELAVPAEAVFVGYGLEDGITGGGIKRQGQASLEACPPEDDDQIHLCWYGPATVCYGDSGGPLLYDDGSGYSLAGVSSWHHWTEEEGTCGGWSIDLKISAVVDFIYDQGQTDIGTMAEAERAVEEDNVRSAHADDLEAGEDLLLEFKVPKGTSELRLHANASRGSEISLYLARGQEPDTIIDAGNCDNQGGAWVAWCNMKSPASGKYFAMIRAGGITPEVQITATTIGGAPVARDDQYTLVEALAVSVENGVTQNDDPGIEQPRAVLVEDVALGELQLEESGAFSYTAAPDFVGAVEFRYRLESGEFLSETASVRLELTGPEEDGEGDSGGCGCSQDHSGGNGSGLGLVLLALAWTARRRCGVAAI